MCSLHESVHTEAYPWAKEIDLDLHTIAITATLSGAIAILSPSGEVDHVRDLPVSTRGSLAWINGQGLTAVLLDSRLYGRPTTAVIENHVEDTTGLVMGSILAVLQTRSIRFELVTGNDWRHAVDIDAELGLAGNRALAIGLARWARNRQVAPSSTQETIT